MLRETSDLTIYRSRCVGRDSLLRRLRRHCYSNMTASVESENEQPHISDNIRPAAQLSVVQSDFGRFSDYEDAQQHKHPKTVMSQRERNHLVNQIQRGALQQRMPSEVSPAGEAMLQSAAAYLQSKPNDPVQSGSRAIEMHIQSCLYARREAARVRDIQNDSLRMDEVLKILDNVRSAIQSVDEAEAYKDFWTNFGDQLEETDPCRATVWSSLPESVRSEIEKATRRATSARSLRSEA
jgi:hypothetical protein